MSKPDLTRTLRLLDGPVEPPLAFREDLWSALESELSVPEASESHSPGGGIRHAEERSPLVATPSHRRRLPGPLMGAAALVLVLLAGLFSWWLAGGREPAEEVVIDEPTLTTEASILPEGELADGILVLPEGLHPQQVATDGDLLFVIATPRAYEDSELPQERATVVAMDRRGTVSWQTELRDAPTRVAAGEGGVWVAHFANGSVTRLDPNTGGVEATIDTELPFDFGGPDGTQFIPRDLEVGFGSVWMSTARGAVARIEPLTNTVTDVIALTPGAVAQMNTDGTSVWVTESLAGLVRIDPSSNEATTIADREDLGHSADFVAADEEEGVVWVAGRMASSEYRVSAIDPDDDTVLGGVRLEEQGIFLGYLNGFFGVLDQTGVFHHLAPRPPVVSDATMVDGIGEGWITQVGRDAWLIDQAGRRLVPLQRTGSLPAAQLPFKVDDPRTPRSIPDQLAASPDWELLDPPPISPRWPTVITWTGRELVIWGGKSGSGAVYGDGAAYDPATGTWREMAPSPWDAPDDPGWVWTGDELVMWAAGQAAAWDPTTNTWRELGSWHQLRVAPLRAGSFYRRAVWTGDKIIDTHSGYSFDPRTGAFREIAPVPDAHDRAQVVWTGREVVFITGEGRYDPEEDRWQPMSQSDLTPLSVDGVWSNGRLLAVDYLTRAAAYHPDTDTWETLPQLPLQSGECVVSLHLVAETVVVDYCGPGALWDAASGTWVPIASPTVLDYPTLVPAGDELYAFGQAGFFRFTPDLQQAWTEINRVVIGLPLDRPEGWEITPGERAPMSVGLTTPNNEECVVTATRASAQVLLARSLKDGAEPIQIEPRIGGHPYYALHAAPGVIDDHHHLLWAPFSNLVLDIRCESGNAAQTILEHFLLAWE